VQLVYISWPAQSWKVAEEKCSANFRYEERRSTSFRRSDITMNVKKSTYPTASYLSTRLPKSHPSSR
jgi:hypothetical protein